MKEKCIKNKAFKFGTVHIHIGARLYFRMVPGGNKSVKRTVSETIGPNLNADISLTLACPGLLEKMHLAADACLKTNATGPNNLSGGTLQSYWSLDDRADHSELPPTGAFSNLVMCNSNCCSS